LLLFPFHFYILAQILISMQKAFTPIKLRNLTLRNRFIKTATNEGMWTDCLPNQALVEHHARLARGGVGLTTVAYGAVNPDGRTNEWQMYMNPEVVPGLRQQTDEVHKQGGSASLQLTHCGFFTNNRLVSGKKPLAPSRIINNYGLLSGIFYSKAMTTSDLRLTTTTSPDPLASRQASMRRDPRDMAMSSS
jgi:2,4-dienoyl-CoA reductase-like NADH-dependent reductase (Old Yellow Enzyme family)